MSVYLDLLHAVNCGKKYRINLKEKTLKIDGKEIVLDDRTDLIDRTDLVNLHIYKTNDPWEVLEQLYAKYKRSAPSAHYQGNKPYFKATDVEELDDNEIAFNEARNLMQSAIEGYVLLAGLSGLLKWQNDDHWFWQSSNFRELIVLKEWV